MTGEAREQIQTIVRIIEWATFLTAGLIAWFVWRVSKRARKRSKPGDSD